MTCTNYVVNIGSAYVNLKWNQHYYFDNGIDILWNRSPFSFVSAVVDSGAFEAIRTQTALYFLKKIKFKTSSLRSGSSL